MSLGDLGTMLNAAIALIFLYLALGLACAAVLEAIAARFDRRAKMLRERIEEMLTPTTAPTPTNDPAKALHATSIIKGLSGQGWPSCIPAIEFASGVVEMASTTGELDKARLHAPSPRCTTR